MKAFEWQGETLILHPSRCIYWEKENLLILSDLHLGKSGHFRKEGIPIPQKVYQEDLERLFDTIRSFKANQVLIVGDLFHSRANLEWEWFGKWRTDFAHVGFSLVLGNHDKLPDGLDQLMGIDVHEHLEIGPFYFLHNAEERPVSFPENAPLICGHIHPAIRVATGAKQSQRLPCFHFTKSICTLPAFSKFTGNMTVKPKASDFVFAIAGNHIIEV